MSNDKIATEIRKKIEELKIDDNGKDTNPRNFDLKNYDEVKTYLDNLFIEYSFQCNGEKLPDGCYRLANYLENIKNDFEQATSLHKKNCDETKYERSCFQYAKANINGRGCQVDFKEAFKYSLISCGLGNPNACYLAGNIEFNEDHGEAKDFKRATGLLEKACENGVVYSCVRLFDVYLNGSKYGLERNPNRALSSTIKACDMGYYPGCVNASIMYKKGDGIPKDEKLSKVYKEKTDSLVRSLKKSAAGVSFGNMHDKV